MAKDPAFLFYPGDWLGGTLGMTFEEKGAYIDMLIYQFNRGSFTKDQALKFLRDDNLWKTISIKFTCKDGLYCNLRLKEEQEKRKAYTESRRKSRLKTDEDNVRIYIVRDNVRKTYKIGSSVNPVRRYNELNNQKNPAIMHDENPKDRNITLIWYSEPVLRSEEKRLHKYFNAKHITGEWFSLIDKDLDYIFNKYKGIYKERTLIRTEDKDENEDIIKDLNESVIKTIEFISEKFGITEMKHFLNYKTIHDCVICQFSQDEELFKHFKDQIWNYFMYKEKAKEKLHSFKGFIGTPEEKFIDGGWNAENWNKKHTGLEIGEVNNGIEPKEENKNKIYYGSKRKYETDLTKIKKP